MATTRARAVSRRRAGGKPDGDGASPAEAAYLELLPLLQSLDAQLALALRRGRAQRGAEPGSRLDDIAADFERRPGAPRYAGPRPGSALSAGAKGRFADLCAAFSLSEFDADLLLLALAPELDARYARAYAFLADDGSRATAPSGDLALDLLCATPAERLDRRQHFLDSAPLMRQALIEWLPEPEPTLLARRYRVAPDVAEALLAIGPITPLLAGLRRGGRGPLSQLAQRLDCRLGWDDLVLPDDALEQLREICGQHRHRAQVLYDWGFGARTSLGRGLAVMFSGPPGTGKTLAAGIVARELGLELYRIDLSRVVSKFIGETEKNLERVFAAATSAGAILFFDEADALFGKRSEVKDAHDRYANLEIAYLLQRMEEYEGVAILATNLRQNMDEAFVRRLQVIVEFPFPDEPQRRLIWSRMFPPRLPLAGDVDLDLLARELRVSGAHIRNIALAAAYFAAESGAALGMSHLWRAARREHQKLGRSWSAPVPAPSA